MRESQKEPQVSLTMLRGPALLVRRHSSFNVARERRRWTGAENAFELVRRQRAVTVLVTSLKQRHQELLAAVRQFRAGSWRYLHVWYQVLPAHLKRLVVAKASEHRPRCLVASALDEEAVEEEEAAEGNTVVADAVRRVLHQHGLDLVEHGGLKRRVETPALEVIELVVVQQPIAVDVTHLER